MLVALVVVGLRLNLDLDLVGVELGLGWRSGRDVLVDAGHNGE